MNLRFFIRNKSPVILAGFAVIGVISTAVSAIRATNKLPYKLEEFHDRHPERDITAMDKLRVAVPLYLPMVLSGAATITCILGSAAISRQMQISLASAYAMVDRNFRLYTDAVKELYGQDVHDEIVNHIVVERAKEVHITAVSMFKTCDLSMETSNPEYILFYDDYSNRFFESTIEQVQSAEYHLNRNYILRGYAMLNELYSFLGLSPIPEGDGLSWVPEDESEYWIDFNHRKIEDKDRTIYAIEMPVGPSIHEYY